MKDGLYKTEWVVTRTDLNTQVVSEKTFVDFYYNRNHSIWRWTGKRWKKDNIVSGAGFCNATPLEFLLQTGTPFEVPK